MNKIASIYQIEIIPVSEITRYENEIGSKSLKFTSPITFMIIPSSVEFSENGSNGNMKEVELKFKVTKTDFDWSLINGVPVLISLLYTNLDKKVVGTKDSPCLLDIASGGTPTAYTFTYKGNQPEFSKLLMSF